MILLGCKAVPAAVLVWLQIAVQATGTPVRTPCPHATGTQRAGPDKMVVVAAPAPYFTWEECNSNGYQSEPINVTKHAGVVKSM